MNWVVRALYGFWGLACLFWATLMAYVTIRLALQLAWPAALAAALLTILLLATLAYTVRRVMRPSSEGAIQFLIEFGVSLLGIDLGKR